MLEMLSWKELSQETKRKILWYEIRFWGSSLILLFFFIIGVITAIGFIVQKISPELALIISILCLIGVTLLKSSSDEHTKEIPKLFGKIKEELNLYYNKKKEE